MATRWFWGWSRDEAASALAALLLRWIWGLSFVPSLIYGAWSVFQGSWGPNVALGMFGAFGIALVIVVAVKVYALMEQFQMLAENKTPGLQPTVEMLEAGRRVLEARRVQQIEKWRALVAYANHQAGQAGEIRSAVATVEGDPRFVSLHRWLSEETKKALCGQPIILEGGVNPPTTPYALRCIRNDIDRLEQEWRLI